MTNEAITSNRMPPSTVALNRDALPPHVLASRKRRPFLMRHRSLVPLISLVVFFGLWQAVGSQVSPLTFATPTAVAKAIGHLASDGELWSAFKVAMGDFAAGFALAVVVGLVVGTVMGRSQIAERALTPYVNFVQAMPSVAALPLVVVWFGVGYEARVSFVFWLALLPMVISTHAGTRLTPMSLQEVAKIYKLGRFTTLRRIVMPAAMPQIFTGLRRAVGLGLIGMILAQMDISVNGLGGLVVNYGNELRTDYLLAAICIAAAVGVVAVAILELIRRTLFPWIDALAGRER